MNIISTANPLIITLGRYLIHYWKYTLLQKIKEDVDKHFRVGIGLDNFDQVIANLKVDGVEFIMDPTNTDFGFMAIVADPDSRKVELYKN